MIYELLFENFPLANFVHIYYNRETDNGVLENTSVRYDYVRGSDFYGRYLKSLEYHLKEDMI